MDDAIERTPTKEQKDHSFFKQFKRKQPADFKGAAPLNKNTRADADATPNNSNDGAVPSTSTTTAEDTLPLTILGNES